MAKRVDITEKLSFDTNPCIVIKDQEFEVNTDAATVLRILGLMNGKSEPEVDDVMGAFDLIFPEESKQKLNEMKLSFRDLMVVVEEAMGLVTGESEGEQ